MSKPEPDLAQISEELSALRRALKVVSALMWLTPISVIWQLVATVPKYEKIFTDMLGGTASLS